MSNDRIDWPSLIEDELAQSLIPAEEKRRLDGAPHGLLVAAMKREYGASSNGEASQMIADAVDDGALDLHDSGFPRTYTAVQVEESAAEEDAGLQVDDAVAAVVTPDTDSGVDVVEPPAEWELLLGDDEYPASDRVQECYDVAMDYFASLMTDEQYDLLESKWGISRETAEELRIGYSGSDGELASYLREQGFSSVEVVRTGLVTPNPLNHVLGLGSSCPEDCHHDYPDKYEALADRVAGGDVDRDEVSVERVLRHAEQDGLLSLYDWWDNRLVFPYRDEDGRITYSIARETVESDDIDHAKYIKQSVSSPWVDTGAVQEPLYGVYCLDEVPESLILTEGVADAISAHQAGLNCLSPVTKQFKKEHLDLLKDYCERAENVYFLFDSEESGQGIGGALASASYLREEGVDAQVAELPRPDGVAKMDLAEFLKTHDADDVMGVLGDAVAPTEHPEYDAEKHGVKRPSEPSDLQGLPKGASGANQSALYDLDVRDLTGLSPTDSDVDNPIQHHGSSHRYFGVFSNGGTYLAKDQKGDGGSGWVYNGLLYAISAGYGDPQPPTTPLSDEDIWTGWLWAKQNGHLGDDDPVPYRAMVHVSRKDDLPVRIPDDDNGFDRGGYNYVLGHIQQEYGVSPGRRRLTEDGGERDDRSISERLEDAGSSDDDEAAAVSAMFDAVGI